MSDKINKTIPKLEKTDLPKLVINEGSLPVTPQDYIKPPEPKPPKQDKRDK